MKLITKHLEKRFAKVGRQNNEKDPVVIAKFFNPSGRGTWFATEFDPVRELFYGYVSIFGDHCDEWGYFSLAELKEFKGNFGLGIERDRYFTETESSLIIADCTRN